MGLLHSQWKVCRTLWPYPEGYGVYRKHLISGRKTLLEHGLTREEAKQTAYEENHSNI